MTDIEGGIRELISSRYKSVPKFAEVIGLPSQTVYSALRNGLSGASMSTVMPIAEELGLDPFQLARKRIVLTRKASCQAADIPLVTIDAQAGGQREAAPAGTRATSEAAPMRARPVPEAAPVGGRAVPEAAPVGVHPIPEAMHKRYPQAYLLEVFCDSANRALPVGAFALVDPCDSVGPPGDLYLVTIPSSGPIIMRAYVLNNGLELVPDSTDPTFKPIIFDYSNPDVEKPHVFGRVVWYTLPFDWRL